MQIATVKNLELKVEKLSLNKGTTTKLELTPTISKGKVTQKLKDALKNPEFIVTTKDAIKIDYKTKTITALKDTNVTIQAKIANTLSNTVKLNIYWEVNGHRLPPEPDPKVNNATLEGIDSNNNGVRDDVERWIYAKFTSYNKCVMQNIKKHFASDGSLKYYTYTGVKCEKKSTPIPKSIRLALMDAAKEELNIKPNYALESQKKVSKARDCLRYIARKYATKSLIENPYIKNYPYLGVGVGDEYDDILYNTSKRAKWYAEYNYNLSGNVFWSTNYSDELEPCSPEARKAALEEGL